MIEVLNDGRTFVRQGPIQMILDIKKDDEISQSISYETANFLINEFNGLLEYMPKLKKMRYFKEAKDGYPEVLNKMIIAVLKSGYEDLNTLGAVAGAFSDITLKKALELGATRVIVNNGGDIALKDTRGQAFKVGIPYKEDDKSKQLILTVDDKEIQGICTSGMGGRSLTKGIATAVVICAENAAIADACATYVANETNVEDENILRCLAEEIDPETDIKGQMITCQLGSVNEKKKLEALLKGLNLSEDLYKRGIIKGAVLVIDNNIVKYPENLKVEML